MALCENCKTKIKEKKESKKETIEETPGANNIFLGVVLGAGALAGGYFLLKKYAKPTAVIQSPILSTPQSTIKKEEAIIQID